MRTIVKADAPACLAMAEKKGWSWEDFVANDKAGYRACRQQADAEQQAVCAYTELPLDVDKVMVHIDHFRRKGIYQKLRFKWDNLFAAVKDHRFGSDYKDRMVNSKNEKQIYASILIPLTDNLQSFFHYATNGKIEPSANLTEAEQQRAQDTIDIFNLNEPELVNRRRTMMVLIQSYNDVPEEVVRGCFAGFGFPSVIDQEMTYIK